MRRLALAALVITAACTSPPMTSPPATQEPVATSTPPPTAAPNISITHYRSDLGRTGEFAAAPIQSPVQVLWQHPLAPSVHGAPVLADNTLFVPTVSKRLFALDAASGGERWTFTASGDLFSSPAIVDDAVYIGNENGTLYALDADTGQEKQSLELDGGVWTAPLIVDDLIYVGTQSGTVYAIEITTFGIRWQFKAAGALISPPAYEGGRVFVSGGPNLYALDRQTGSVIWEFALSEFWGPVAWCMSAWAIMKVGMGRVRCMLLRLRPEGSCGALKRMVVCSPHQPLAMTVSILFHGRALSTRSHPQPTRRHWLPGNRPTCSFMIV